MVSKFYMHFLEIKLTVGTGSSLWSSAIFMSCRCGRIIYENTG